MKQFLSKLFLFFLTTVIFLAPLCIYKIGGKKLKYIDNPTAAIIDKTERLKSTLSPKLVITGGSSAFFGMNSEMIEQKLSMNVVNMALFAGFGLNFILNQTTNYLNNGDIVILNIEYFLKSDCNPKARKEILRFLPSAKKYFPDYNYPFYNKYYNTLKNNIESLGNIILSPFKRKSSIYVHSRTINKYGDAVGYLNYKNPPRLPDRKLSYHYYEGIKQLNDYAKNLYPIGVKIYFIFPPVSATFYKINSNVLKKYYMDLKNKLDIPLLCSPDEMVFDDNLFFDTSYHLNKKGRELRTSRLIKFFLRTQEKRNSTKFCNN